MTRVAEADKAVSLQKQQAPVRLGFVGVGWIGRRRMKALLAQGGIEAAAIAEPATKAADAAREIAPEACLHEDLDGLLGAEDLDGVVIASPSALHAEQAVRALEAGLPVFCQKPMGRTAAEARCVVEAARRADRLLAVDMSYRFTESMQQIRRRVRAGAIGRVFAADLTFHNAYGPDKAWFYDPVRSGGGCVMDLGIHLIDLALWTLDGGHVEAITSRLFAEGRPLDVPATQVEDYAVARLDLADGAAVHLACSWNLPAGQDAVIEAVFYGTEGGLTLCNVDGSFFDFRAERYDGTARRVLAGPPDAWGGRAAVAWAEQLAVSPRFDTGIEEYLRVAAVIDAIYDRSSAFTCTHRRASPRSHTEPARNC